MFLRPRQLPPWDFSGVCPSSEVSNVKCVCIHPGCLSEMTFQKALSILQDTPSSSRRLRFAVHFCTCIVCALTIVTLGRCSPLQALNGICSVPHNIRHCLTGLMRFLYFLFKIMPHLGLEHWYTDEGRKFKLVLIILECMKDLIKPMICLSLKKVNEDNFPFKFFFKC